MSRRRTGASLLALLGAAALVLTGAVPAASAATTASWASWSPLGGSSGAFQGTMTLAGQPALTATITSDSRADAGLVSGASRWLAASTPVGAKYGSSRDQPYLNLRPKADNAASPSTTTYSFATPTPSSGWTFVLGDIDADQVTVTAVGPNGVALTAEQLGFQSGFNYCAPGLVGKPSCTGSATDVPSWDATTQVLRGNAAALDTDGAAAWFEPSAPVSSLTFSFQRRSGFPVYQAWFASIARDITGTVTDQTAAAPLDGAAVRLIDRDGRVVASTTTAAGGAYAFPGYFATDGYTVQIVPPAGKIAVSPSRVAADLTDADAVADFVVRDVVPVAVSGTALDADGAPIAGATVTIAGVGSVVTDTDGFYLFDTVPVGPHTAVITPPIGYTVQGPPLDFTVPAGSEAPITDQDFLLLANPSLSGVVTSGGAGVAGVSVTADGPDGPVSTVTGADGSYVFPRLVAGEYTVSVSVPSGYVVSGPATRPATLSDADVDAVDFALAPLGGLVGGVVTDAGAPVPGATVTVDTPGGPVVLTTADDGTFGLGELPPGEYEITLTVPDGFSASAGTGGGTTLTVEVAADGSVVVAPNFVIVPDAVVPSPSPSPSVTPSDDPAVPQRSGRLPATGADVAPWLIVGGALLVIGAGSVAIAAVRRRRRG